MLNEHDQDLLLRCRRLGHEVTFGYCRQETGGKPCRQSAELGGADPADKGSVEAQAMTYMV